jgi:site-specific DNA-methyltransferase (adenine-specific)
MKPYYQSNVVTIYHGDCREVMRSIPSESIHAIITDPPYELSQDGKASANLVALEFMFPENPNIPADAMSEDKFAFLIGKIAGLNGFGGVPTPSASMPESAVAFDDQISGRNIDVVDTEKRPILVSDGVGRNDAATNSAEYIGCFSLKLTDAAAMLNTFNRFGCSFYSGGIRIGSRVDSACIPSLLHSLTTIINGDNSVRLFDNSFAVTIGALRGTENFAMPRFDLARRTVETLSATSACVLFSILKSGGAKFVTASTATCSLPAKLEARRIRVIDNSTNRALTFDLVVCPQNIASRGFMGKEWDGSKIANDVKMWAECLRVLRPGGHLLSFGGSRTYHRMACAIEDAGFEIRDQIMWLYGSGFPKSLDVSKAIDKAAGAARPVVGVNTNGSGPNLTKLDNHGTGDTGIGYMDGSGKVFDVTAPATEEARQWQGYGTALKPAHEPVCVARKPIEGTVAANVLKNGTGALNIDGCRIETDESGSREHGGKVYEGVAEGYKRPNKSSYTHKTDWSMPPQGRWPANVIHDGSDEVVSLFPQASGQQGFVGEIHGDRPSINTYGDFGPRPDTSPRGDSGSAARFFYTAKADKEERERNMDSALSPLAYGNQAQAEVKRGNLAHAGKSGINTVKMRGNTHPTVKPLDLMAYLCKLLCPPSGGILLDPFIRIARKTPPFRAGMQSADSEAVLNSASVVALCTGE